FSACGTLLAAFPFCLFRIHPSGRPLLCFFFNDTATTEIYTLSLHDALPIWRGAVRLAHRLGDRAGARPRPDHLQRPAGRAGPGRSEEHTSELQSLTNLVCRLLLEKKKQQTTTPAPTTPDHQPDETPRARPPP